MGIKTNQAELSSHSILGNKMAAFFLNLLFKGNYSAFDSAFTSSRRKTFPTAVIGRDS